MPENNTRYPAEAWDILQHLFYEKSINDHTLHFVAECSGTLDIDRLKRAVARMIEAFPLIRCNYREENGAPYWEDNAFTADDMIRLIESEEKEEGIRRFLCERIESGTGPQLKIGIMRNGKTDILCVTMNHMLCDGGGFKEFLYLLCWIYAHLDDKAMELPVQPMKNRQLSQLLKPFSFGEKLKIFSSKNDMTTHDTAKYTFEGDLKNPFIETRMIPREDFRALKSYAKAHGATVNDIIMTAMIRVLHDIFGHVIAVPCAMDLRKFLPKRKSGGICNLVTNLKCDIGQELGASFAATLEKVKPAMAKQKADTSCLKSISLLEKALHTLPYRTARKLIDKNFTNPPVAFTNIGILDKNKLIFGDIRLTHAYMTGSIKYNPYFQLAVTTFDDEMVLSVNLYGTESDRNQISLFLNKMNDELRNAME